MNFCRAPFGGFVEWWPSFCLGTSLFRCSYINSPRIEHKWLGENNKRWREDNMLHWSDWQNVLMGHIKRSWSTRNNFNEELSSTYCWSPAQSGQRRFMWFRLLYRPFLNCRESGPIWQNIVLRKLTQSKTEKPSWNLPKARNRRINSPQSPFRSEN